MDKKTVGIIGLGSFGQFTARTLAGEGRVVVRGYDPEVTDPIANLTHLPLGEVAASDVVVLAIPLKAYPEVLENIASVLPQASLLVDVCSVKTVPMQLIAKHLPHHHAILATHPLFGPQAAAKTTKGHSLIVTKAVGPHAAGVLRFCKETLGLHIIRTTDEAHDKAMAEVHAATFFVARALAKANLGDVPFETPSFQMLRNLIAFDASQSDELFTTIEQGNPYAAEVRQRVLDSFLTISDQLKEG